MAFTVLFCREMPKVKATMTPSVSETFSGHGFTGGVVPTPHKHSSSYWSLSLWSSLWLHTRCCLQCQSLFIFWEIFGLNCWPKALSCAAYSAPYIGLEGGEKWPLSCRCMSMACRSNECVHNLQPLWPVVWLLAAFWRWCRVESGVLGLILLTTLPRCWGLDSAAQSWVQIRSSLRHWDVDVFESVPAFCFLSLIFASYN